MNQIAGLFFVDTLALIKIGLTCFPKIALFISRKS